MPGSHFLAPLLRSADNRLWLSIANHEVIVATSIVGAFDSGARRRGLLGRSGLDEQEALVIAPCSAIHTFGMRFPIDVVFVRRDGHVLKIRRSLVANRMSAAWGAFAVVELAAGAADRAGLREGDRLSVVEPSTTERPSA